MICFVKLHLFNLKNGWEKSKGQDREISREVTHKWLQLGSIGGYR